MNLLLGYLGVVLGYILPLALIYNFVYRRSGGILTIVFLFICTYMIGLLACLLFYRMAIKNESGQIANISRSVLLRISSTTFLSYMIVAITLFAISFNPGFVEIFENTLGFFYIQFFGATQFANNMFTSPTLDEIKDNVVEDDYSLPFNYAFLLTQFNSQNVQSFVKYITSSCQEEQEDKLKGEDFKLPLNFQINTRFFDHQGKIDEFEEFIYSKHRIGHFAWVYFTSILSFTVAAVAMTMSS